MLNRISQRSQLTLPTSSSRFAGQSFKFDIRRLQRLALDLDDGLNDLETNYKGDSRECHRAMPLDSDSTIADSNMATSEFDLDIDARWI